MKKKQFYNNKKRNSKWTERETGRKISFADKYIEAGTGSDKFDSKRPKQKKKYFTKEKNVSMFKAVLTVLFCFIFLSVGYSAMDLYIDRNAMPETEPTSAESASLSAVNLQLKSTYVDSISLDGGVMLDAVIDEAEKGGYSSVAFDLKRDDGTIGYESTLAAIGTYGAVSSPSLNLKKSVGKLTETDLLPVARISCYKDSIVATSDLDCAVKDGKSVYKDSDGNSYINPDSDKVYSYIKSIIEETRAMGISVFLLDNCDLPSDVKGDYGDGFDPLAKKLYADFGEDIKLIEAVNVELDDPSVSSEQTNASQEETSDEYDSTYTEESTDYAETTDETTDDTTDETAYETSESGNSLEKQIDEKISEKSPANKMYFIKTNNPDSTKKILDNKKINNYIIVAVNDGQ